MYIDSRNPTEGMDYFNNIKIARRLRQGRHKGRREIWKDANPDGIGNSSIPILKAYLLSEWSGSKPIRLALV